MTRPKWQSHYFTTFLSPQDQPVEGHATLAPEPNDSAPRNTTPPSDCATSNSSSISNAPCL